jgi:hypothetical protein
MARRPKTVGIESSIELARKTEILERELATQRDALERLKQMASSRQPETTPEQTRPMKRPA